MTRTGLLAVPPIALVEVQGYAYLAKHAIAGLFERDGQRSRADELRRDARELRDRFNRDFWVEATRFFALALYGESQAPADVISSNPGQALWTGIIDPERAGWVVDRLLADDMYSGWGVRTLSANERAYNPLGYHLGTVWPHDNALFVAGLRRYGFDREACRVFSDLLHAATFFEHDRLPETFAGFPRAGYGVPVRYPMACHPQAWASGSVPFMLGALLGLEPDAFARRLTIVRPCLPPFVESLCLRQLRVGAAEADLMFERTPDGLVARTDRVSGDLEVVVKTGR